MTTSPMSDLASRWQTEWQKQAVKENQTSETIAWNLRQIDK